MVEVLLHVEILMRTFFSCLKSSPSRTKGNESGIGKLLTHHGFATRSLFLIYFLVISSSLWHTNLSHCMVSSILSIFGGIGNGLVTF